MAKFQAPAFAEAASRRQANNQINSNHQYPNCFSHRFLFGYWDLVIIWTLEFGYWNLSRI
jgi:hypothetical protein